MAKKKSNLSRALLKAQEQQQRAQKLKQKNNNKQTTSRAHQSTKNRAESSTQHAHGHHKTHHQTVSNPITSEANISAQQSSNILQRNEMQSPGREVNLDHEIGSPHSRKENGQPAQTDSADRPNKSHTKPRISMVNKNDQVLLVGEGNFSFTVSLLVEHSHPGSLITASTIDTKETVLKKYPDAEGILKFLEEKNVTILFELDGCKLNEDKRMKKSKMKFDKVIFNFPHVGGSEPDQDRNVRANQILILRFLRSASTLLFQPPDGYTLGQGQDRKKKRARSSTKNAKKQRLYSHSSDSEGDRDRLESDPESDAELDLHVRKPGTVLITAGTCPPYSLWDVPALAKNGNILAHTILYPIHPSLKQKGEQPVYKLIRSFNFEKSIVNSHGSLTYQHRQTNGFKNSQKDTRPVNPRTWEFQLLCPSSPLSQSW